MTILKQIILIFGFMGCFVNTSLATNVDFNFSVTPVTKNVYSIVSPSYGRPSPENKGWNSNSHFIVTGKGVLVFDTGSSELIGNEIIKAIKTVTQQPIRWVVNSHSHADHWLGNAAFANVGAEIYSTSPSIAAMKEDGQGVVDAFSRMTKGATGLTHAYYPTSLLIQKEKRNLGGVDVEFILSNDGHSPGDILMWLPKEKIIFGGDVLSSDWMPIMTPRGNVPNLIATLHAVIKLNPAIVLPGHGKATTVKSVSRDAQFLESVSQRLKNSNNNDTKTDDNLLKVINELSPKYKILYKDFDENIEYLVTTISKKQK